MNEQILDAVEDTLRCAKVFRADATLLVALSGGPDSVALLAALCALQAAAGFQVRAAHVEHGLRGEASLADARFCEQLCVALKVPFTCDHAGLAGDMHAPGAETRARAARYALLLNRARACHADALLLAHHLDDQVETVLAHLLRGSGARGLAGMRPVTTREGILLLRPLLTLPKQLLVEALESMESGTEANDPSACPPCAAEKNNVSADAALPYHAASAATPAATSAGTPAAKNAPGSGEAVHAALRGTLRGMPYRIDETNGIACCQRNRLRLEVLPLLTRENPRAAEHIAQSAALLALDEDCLQAQADALFSRTLEARPPLYCLRKAPLLAAAPAIALRVLRRFVAEGQALMAGEPTAAAAMQAPLAEAGEHSLSAPDSLALLRLLSAVPGTALGLPQGLQASIGSTCLHLTRMAGDGAPLLPVPPPAAMPLGAVIGDILFAGIRLQLRPFDPKREPVPDGITRVALPNARLRGCTLRVPEPGDHIHPFGAPGGKPLRRYLTDRRVDSPFRRVLPVLCDGQEALWVAGIGAAEGTRLPADEQPCTLVCLLETPPWMAAPA